MTATTVIPTSATELEEMLVDEAKMKALFAEPAAFGEFITNYARTVMDKDASIAMQVKEETQRVLAQWLKETGGGNVPVNLAPHGPQPRDRGAAYNPKAVGAALDKEFPDVTDYLRTIWFDNHAPDAAAKRAKIRNDYSTVVPADGGFLVPEVLRSQLLQVSLEKSIVRPRAMVVPMENERVPFPMIDSTTNAGSVFGGMIAYWTEEAATLQKSQAKFGRVVLDAQKLTGYSVVPNELFTASILAFQAFLEQKWPQALAFAEDAAFFSGTGVGEPLGFLNAGNTAAVSVAKESGQSADTILWENIVKMFARMLPTSLSEAVWIANIDTFPELATMALSVGTGGGPIWLSNGQEGPPMTILGRPVIFTEKAETVGDAGDINFVDLGYYLIGDRQTMQMATSEHKEFDSDQTAVRIIQRADGKPWIKSAITPRKGANSLTPFVKIAARA